MNYQGSINAPSTATVVPFFVASAFSWLFSVLLIAVFGATLLETHYFNPITLGITHLVVLGFVTNVIFGALFQLLPVIFIRKIYSEVLGKIVFWFFLFGFLGIVIAFFIGISGLWLTLSGSLVNIAVILFIINAWKTIGDSKEKFYKLVNDNVAFAS